MKVDVIVTTGAVILSSKAMQAFSAIPTVFATASDPVGNSLVASLARPGGNVTGLTFLGPQLVPKRLALLKEALPSASQVASGTPAHMAIAQWLGC